jgi:serine/threonine-protein kinase
MAKLQHPNIVQLIEFRKTASSMYLVMEYVDGYNLLQMVSQDFYFSAETALEMLYCLADAFKYAWDNCNLLHRDIKPSNIMITSDGVMKILDFGLSKQCDVETGLTSVGQALGSPGFMSPEQFRDSRIYDCRSDIFSLGATLYFVLSGGKMPYPGKSPLAAYQSMISTVPQKLSQVASDVPESLSELVMSMIHKDIAKRPSSWDDLMNKVEYIANSL